MKIWRQVLQMTAAAIIISHESINSSIFLLLKMSNEIKIMKQYNEFSHIHSQRQPLKAHGPSAFVCPPLTALKVYFKEIQDTKFHLYVF